jgi:hypothetical protein
VNYGAGEITDRLTILSLKMLHGKAAGKPIDHFGRERDVLLTQIRARTLNGAWAEQLFDLAAVNAALWTAEDHLRIARARFAPPQDARLNDGDVEDVCQLAFRIQELNDRRAELITLINANTGEKDGEEKV